MDTRSAIFVTMGNRISPSGYPIHGQVKGELAAPFERKICPLSAAKKAGPSSLRVCWLARATCETPRLVTS
jgi:hypothetical protein